MPTARVIITVVSHRVFRTAAPPTTISVCRSATRARRRSAPRSAFCQARPARRASSTPARPRPTAGPARRRPDPKCWCPRSRQPRSASCRGCSRAGRSGSGGHQYAVVSAIFKGRPGAHRDADQRIVGDPYRQTGRARDRFVHSAEQRAAAGERNAFVDHVGGEFGGRALERDTDRADDLPHRFRQRLGDLRLRHARSEEHTSELQSLMRISYAVFCLKKKKKKKERTKTQNNEDQT